MAPGAAIRLLALPATFAPVRVGEGDDLPALGQLCEMERVDAAVTELVAQLEVVGCPYGRQGAVELHDMR